MRCIHIAAFSLAGARIASIAATSGTGMPVSHEPGASVTDRSACTCSAPRNVLSHDARYSNASPRVYRPAITPSAVAAAARCSTRAARAPYSGAATRAHSRGSAASTVRRAAVAASARLFSPAPRTAASRMSRDRSGPAAPPRSTSGRTSSQT